MHVSRLPAHGAHSSIQVSALPSAAAIRLSSREFRQRLLSTLYLLLIPLQNLLRLVPAPRDARLAPACWAPALVVLHQQMRCSDLAFAGTGTIHIRDPPRAAVILAHVLLQLLIVRACWRLPSRVLRRRMEIIGEVLAVRYAHLPPLGQSRRCRR